MWSETITVGQAKEHDLQDVETEEHFEHGLPLVFRAYADVMVPPSDVEGSEQNLPIKVL